MLINHERIRGYIFVAFGSKIADVDHAPREFQNMEKSKTVLY